MRNSPFIFQPPRIKKFIRQNPEIGKMKYEVSAVLAMSVELFLRDVFKDAQKVCSERGGDAVDVKHLKLAMQNYPHIKTQEAPDDSEEAPELLEVIGCSGKKPETRGRKKKKKDQAEEGKKQGAIVSTVELNGDEPFAF